MCGGTLFRHLLYCRAEGLSPRVRGNLYRARSPVGIPRSIPACAGEPAVGTLIILTLQVYPRVCGGTGCDKDSHYTSGGLSPRVRGNQLARRESLAAPGSIPACAGEPVHKVDFRAMYPVYPRVCGGTSAVRRLEMSAPGLSPRVRGNPAVLGRHLCGVGSIPACAGEPYRAKDCSRHSMVYPRVCGGTQWDIRMQIFYYGLSPRVRGNRSYQDRADFPNRSIPACAGEPQQPTPAVERPEVYPRVCGGTVIPQRAGRLWAGLSPRVRGNQSSPAASIPN